MFRGTTPTISIKVKNTNITLANMQEIWVTLKSLGLEKTYTKTDSQLNIVETTTDKRIELPLSQDDTLAFSEGRVKLQVRLLDNTDLAYSSKIISLELYNNLKDGKIYVE